MTPNLALDAAIRQARYLLISFDGPVCTLFPGVSAESVASQLRQTITDAGVQIDRTTRNKVDWILLYRYAAAFSDSLPPRLEAQLTKLESAAAANAIPTPHIHDLLTACRDSGRTPAIFSAHSSAAVSAFLAAHDLASQVAVVAARTDPDRANLPPSGHLISQAASALGTRPTECLAVVSSIHDIFAARSAQAPFIGYARTEADADYQAEKGARATVYSLAEIALRLRAHLLPN